MRGRNGEPILAVDIEAEIVEIYEQYMEGIYCFCLCRLRAIDLAEEATSEVFLKFVEKYLSLKINGQKKKTEVRVRKWLYGAAKNEISRQFRQINRHKTNVLDNAAVNAIGIENKHGFEKFDHDGLCDALGRLNDQDRQIIIHRYWKDSNTSDIAEMMGLEHGTVRVRLSRAIRTLRKYMGMRYV